MSLLKDKINRILLRLQNDDQASPEELFNAVYNHLVALARQYLTDKNDAYDVASHALLRAMKHIGTFNPAMDGYNWLCRITQRVAYVFNDKGKTEKKYWEKAVASLGVKSDPMENIEQRLDVEMAISELDEDDEKMMRMRFYEDRTLESIGAEMGINKATVHYRIYKCLDILRKKLSRR